MSSELCPICYWPPTPIFLQTNFNILVVWIVRVSAWKTHLYGWDLKDGQRDRSYKKKRYQDVLKKKQNWIEHPPNDKYKIKPNNKSSTALRIPFASAVSFTLCQYCSVATRDVAFLSFELHPHSKGRIINKRINNEFLLRRGSLSVLERERSIKSQQSWRLELGLVTRDTICIFGIVARLPFSSFRAAKMQNNKLMTSNKKKMNMPSWTRVISCCQFDWADCYRRLLYDEGKNMSCGNARVRFIVGSNWQ